MKPDAAMPVALSRDDDGQTAGACDHLAGRRVGTLTRRGREDIAEVERAGERVIGSNDGQRRRFGGSAGPRNHQDARSAVIHICTAVAHDHIRRAVVETAGANSQPAVDRECFLEEQISLADQTHSHRGERPDDGEPDVVDVQRVTSGQPRADQLPDAAHRHDDVGRCVRGDEDRPARDDLSVLRDHDLGVAWSISVVSERNQHFTVSRRERKPTGRDSDDGRVVGGLADDDPYRARRVHSVAVI